MENNETNYVDIAKYLKEQEARIKEVNEFHIDENLRLKECAAIVDGTINYLWRNGFGEYEIDLLIKDMLKLANEREIRKWIN